MASCPHSVKLKLDGMCKPCADGKPYMVFRICKEQCFKCKECGWFWGPGADKLAGKPVYGSLTEDDPSID